MIEACNGLDDDCNGKVDDGCTELTGCLDDQACGVFACVPPDNQSTTVCAPRNTAASVTDFSPCTDSSQCHNGLCETGLCSPLCREDSNDCRSDLLCTRAVGPKSRPLHNVCQKPCVSDADCAGVAGQICAWRDVFQGGDLHAFVCSFPGPDRKPIGATCSGNNPAGDDECASGLCFGGFCTRTCTGPSDSCSDMTRAAPPASFGCGLQVMLIYGILEVNAQVCVRM
jgi:hypothetical protein